MTLPSSPFAPIRPLFICPPDSNLLVVLAEADALVRRSPRLVALVDADLDAHGLRKKERRAADKRWMDERTLRLAGMPCPEADPVPVALEQGRPRTPGYVVLMLLLVRGYLGVGFKERDASSTMADSIALHVYFENLGLKMPGRSTLTELCNAVSNRTRLRILDAQAAQALHPGMDDFKTMLQDSTHVAGNTEWPTDSRLARDLAARLLRVGEKLPHVGLPALDDASARKALRKIAGLDREIGLSQGRKDGARDRRRRYEKLLRHARRVHALLAPQVAALDDAAAALDVLPSRKVEAAHAVWLLHSDLDALAQVVECCEARVLRDQKVPMSEKILSVSDPDAGFIAKGQREPVVGYKPQLGRSGAGFITGVLLPQGNAADSGQLVPMVDAVEARTGVTPQVVSVDDGYASADNKKALALRGVRVTSINGAKGKALTAPADWDSDEYREARDLRSAVESLMYTLKQGYHFGQAARRGLCAVYAEMLEKALAYNLCLTARMRRAEAEPDRADENRALAG